MGSGGFAIGRARAVGTETPGSPRSLSTGSGICAANDQDREANLSLGEVYQRLDDFVRSDQALGRLLDRSDLPDSEKASALALTARNAVHHWVKEWTGAEADVVSMRTAVTAP